MKIIEYNHHFKSQLIDFILDIQNQEYQLGLTIEDQKDLLDIENEYQKDGNFWLAIDDEGMIQGCVATKCLKQNKAVLKKMFVRKESRGLGLGSRLMRECLTFLRDHKVDQLFLGTVSRLDMAPIFYEHVGFTKIKKDELPEDFPVLGVDNRFYRYEL